MRTYLVKLNQRRRNAIGVFTWAHYLTDANSMEDALLFAQRLAWAADYETAGACVDNPDHAGELSS